MKVLIATLLFVVACHADTFSIDSVLKITKDRAPRVDNLDRFLFNLDEYEYLNPRLVRDLARDTMSRAELETLLAFSIGPGWKEMVELPEEDLSMIEALRLAANLNEMNLKYYNSVNNKKTSRYHGYESGFESGSNSGSGEVGEEVEGFCFCHGTAVRFPCEGYGAEYESPLPFMGIRLFKAGAFIPSVLNTRHYGYGHGHVESGSSGYNIENGFEHDHEAYHNGFISCLLANEVTDPYLARNVRRCCHGFCVLTGEGDPIVAKRSVEEERWSESGHESGANGEFGSFGNFNYHSESGFIEAGTEADPINDLFADHTPVIDQWCDGPNDSDYIRQANRYHCQLNCHTDTCTCNQLLGAYSYKDCGCNGGFLNDVCTCEDAINNTHCTCKETIELIQDETSCGCEEAIEARCTDCDHTIGMFYDALRCTCEEHFEYIDNDIDCSCHDGTDYMCNNCCQVFNFLDDQKGCERFVDLADPQARIDSHANHIADCCVSNN